MGTGGWVEAREGVSKISNHTVLKQRIATYDVSKLALAGGSYNMRFQHIFACFTSLIRPFSQQQFGHTLRQPSLFNKGQMNLFLIYRSHNTLKTKD